jgi:hypothetical protein
MHPLLDIRIGFLAVIVVVFAGFVLLVEFVELVAFFTVIVLLLAGGLQSKFTPSIMKH